MCGFAGIIGSPDETQLDSMISRIRHRGPDDRDKLVTADFALGHNRLSIVDLSDKARQPMTNEARDLHLVFNGEIYNHHALKENLSGHCFRSSTDSEVILHLFEDLGPDVVRHLDGMFAIAIYGRGELFLARDPLGIKPLYYGRDSAGNMYFGSEIKAMPENLPRISEFPAGHWYSTTRGLCRYYAVPEGKVSRTDLDSIISEMRGCLERAVEKRLMSDVPLGVFLSGGLDSSLIAAVTTRMVGSRLKSFGVGIKGCADLINARMVADYLGTDHHEFAYDPEDLVEALPTVIYYLESFDPALVRSAIPTFFVSRLAGQHVKVVLSGEGADELFAGYHYLKEFRGRELHEELRHTVKALHNSNLQRVDRMTMANGIEGRVPFLDTSMVRMAMDIDPGLKIAGDQATEKWILRKAAVEYLPPDTVWRTKEKFAIGTGTGQVLEQLAESTVSDTEFEAERDIPGGFVLKSKEELMYYRIFRDHFDREDVIREMGRSRSLNPGQRYH